MLPCWPGCRPCSTNHWTVLLAVQLQDNHPSAKTSGMQRFRLSTVLCPSARRKPLTCAEINPRWHIRKQGTKVAQPSEREPGAKRGRPGADPAAQGVAGAGGRSHVGSHRRHGQQHHVIRRTRPDLTEGASAPFLLRPAAQLRPARACALRLPKAEEHGGVREAVLLFPSPYHGVLTVKGCARHARWRPCGRLRPLTAALRRAGDGSGQFRPCNRRSS